MKKHLLSPFFYMLLVGAPFSSVQAQDSNNLFVVSPLTDRTLNFSVSDTGVHKPLIWGLDLAWLSEENIRRGIAYMGNENINVIRSSFMPTSPLVNGELQADELAKVKERLRIIGLMGRKMDLVLNSDHPSVDASFVGNAVNWAKLIEVTAKLHEAEGHRVVTVSPFNEPDYSYTGQGTISDFYAIAGELRKNSYFDDIRISGGNTLNCDEALPWYNTLKDRLDEGNTHQLAGTFDGYAKFFETVRANGHHASNDELHNVMEAMVGSEYGMQTGIWWGTAEYARGEFVKSTNGERLAYVEHRPNWSAGSVYRDVDGKVRAFLGVSERQAATTSYRLFSKDKDVYFDGHGPLREYCVTMPGGTGYQIEQANAERMVNITYGDDIQPVIDGNYIVVNRNSGRVMEVASGGTASGTNIRQATNTGAKYQQWRVKPVDSRIGGDFTYFSFNVEMNGKSIDIYNWSLEDKGNIVIWDDAKGNNQQWYLEYAGDGWFYIRNRHSAKCIDVSNSATSQGANILQNELSGALSQQWRFLPVGTAVEFVAPNAPVGLSAQPQSGSVKLTWSENSESDLAGYHIYRAVTGENRYETIGRNIKGTSFVDNRILGGVAYTYRIKAVDASLNKS